MTIFTNTITDAQDKERKVIVSLDGNDIDTVIDAGTEEEIQDLLSCWTLDHLLECAIEERDDKAEYEASRLEAGADDVRKARREA